MRHHLLRTLQGTLVAVRNVFRQTDDVSGRHDHPDDESNRAIVKALHDLKAEIKRRTPEDDKRDRRDRWRFGLEVATLLVGIITMIAVIGYAWVAKGQWSAQRTANEIAEKNFRASPRPWIEPYIAIAKPLTFY